MSHTTTIKGVPIRDIEALTEAVKELNAKGVKCSLVKDQAPRMYYANQHKKCDYVLKLNDCPYDVGFDKNPDGSYAPVTDLFSGHVAKLLGAKGPMPKKANDQTRHAIGKFTALYTKHATLNVAKERGFTVDSILENKEGGYDITLNTSNAQVVTA